jgi:hypothetical protein
MKTYNIFSLSSKVPKVRRCTRKVEYFDRIYWQSFPKLPSKVVYANQGMRMMFSQVSWSSIEYHSSISFNFIILGLKSKPIHNGSTSTSMNCLLFSFWDFRHLNSNKHKLESKPSSGDPQMESQPFLVSIEMKPTIWPL